MMTHKNAQSAASRVIGLYESLTNEGCHNKLFYYGAQRRSIGGRQSNSVFLLETHNRGRDTPGLTRMHLNNSSTHTTHKLALRFLSFPHPYYRVATNLDQ